MRLRLRSPRRQTTASKGRRRGHGASEGRSPALQPRLPLAVARGGLPVGAFLTFEAQKVPLVSGTFFPPTVEFFQWAQQPPSMCIWGPAKSLSDVLPKARPVRWAPRLARHHPLICCLETRHRSAKRLGGGEMSARCPDISTHVTRRW